MINACCQESSFVFADGAAGVVSVDADGVFSVVSVFAPP
jgi:hypothetical protein